MGSTSRFECEDIDINSNKDWDELFATYWQSWKDPLQMTGLLTFPWLGEGNTREEESYEAAKQAYLDLARQNPDQRWVRILDNILADGPRVVGGGAFTTHREAAFRGGHGPSGPSFNIIDDDHAPPDITLPGLGYPVNSDRNVLMRQLYSQMWSWRPRIMSDRPHMCE